MGNSPSKGWVRATEQRRQILLNLLQISGEAGVNVKVIQDTLGHADISTTLNIYADVTKDLKKSEFEGLDKWFGKSMNQQSIGADPTDGNETPV